MFVVFLCVIFPCFILSVCITPFHGAIAFVTRLLKINQSINNINSTLYSTLLQHICSPKAEFLNTQAKVHVELVEK